MTREEVYETLKKYDPELYEYYMKNAWYFGMGAYNYAAYLLKKNKEDIHDKAIRIGFQS